MGTITVTVCPSPSPDHPHFTVAGNARSSTPVDQLVFRISDQGGGLSRRQTPQSDMVWSYRRLGDAQSGEQSVLNGGGGVGKDSGDNTMMMMMPLDGERLAGRLDDPEPTSFSPTPTITPTATTTAAALPISLPSIDDTAIQLGVRLARMFAQYWGGDVRVMSMHGYGCDTYVRIRTSGERAEHLTGRLE